MDHEPMDMEVKALLIVSIIAVLAIVGLFVFLIQRVNARLEVETIERNRTERVRLESCGTIEEPMIRSLCISGFTRSNQ